MNGTIERLVSTQFVESKSNRQSDKHDSNHFEGERQRGTGHGRKEARAREPNDFNLLKRRRKDENKKCGRVPDVFGESAESSGK